MWARASSLVRRHHEPRSDRVVHSFEALQKCHSEVRSWRARNLRLWCRSRFLTDKSVRNDNLLRMVGFTKLNCCRGTLFLAFWRSGVRLSIRCWKRLSSFARPGQLRTAVPTWFVVIIEVLRLRICFAE